MKTRIYRIATVAGSLLAAGSVFAQADTDGFMPPLNYTTLGANVNSVFAQVSPIILVVAGIALALGLSTWVIATLRSVFRSRKAGA